MSEHPVVIAEMAAREAGERVTLRVTLSATQLAALREGLEFALDIGLGRFDNLVELHGGDARGELGERLQRTLKPLLMPDWEGSPHGNYGLGHPKVDRRVHLWYELFKALGGGTPGGNIVHYSGEEFPTVAASVGNSSPQGDTDDHP